MAERPLILLTNDDGIESPGLRALARAVVDLGELLIVAPRQQQTSMGRALHGAGRERTRIYAVGHKRVRAYSVPTSPATAARNAILLLAERTPDLVISGINYGENIGTGVTISGTVGAAIEAATLEVPALAVSAQTDVKYHRSYSKSVNFSVAAQYAREFAVRVLEHGMPRGADLLNLNVPPQATVETGWRWTRVSRHSVFRSKVVTTRRGKRLEGYELNVAQDLVEPDSDIYVLYYDGVVSVTPMTVDLTARVQPEDLERWRADDNQSELRNGAAAGRTVAKRASRR